MVDEVATFGGCRVAVKVFAMLAVEPRQLLDCQPQVLCQVDLPQLLGLVGA